MPAEHDLADRIDGVRTELATLTDLFRRRLLDDRGHRRLVEALQLRAESAEAGLAAQYLLPVVTQLTRLVERAEQNSPDLDPLVVSLLEELRVILENCGVHPIGRVGEPVDPHAHEIRSVLGDSGGPLRVATVIRRGYSYLGKTVRPALVDAVREDGESR